MEDREVRVMDWLNSHGYNVSDKKWNMYGRREVREVFSMTAEDADRIRQTWLKNME